MQLNYLKGARLSETSTVKMLSVLKALAQCHVVLGLIMLILSTLADYVSSRINTIRMYGLEECCSFYFIVTGLVGLCGAASYRRGLVITFLVMSIHAIIIFVPAIIIVSSFDIHFYQRSSLLVDHIRVDFYVSACDCVQLENMHLVTLEVIFWKSREYTSADVTRLCVRSDCKRMTVDAVTARSFSRKREDADSEQGEVEC
ncbi:hypothetical protein ANCCEY_10117 [Ancylostoma ceylanicum]|uniref:Uncharacterized protein n=1 Tax=Ancylostoma ceylanicum TaxID=53326 RepID=A0A0D6LFR5_9BILA|nr:hypothetical protein ANCCEY_10117 [Ancylostoma ceylanicum]